MIEPQHLPILHTPSMNDTHYEATLLINTLWESIMGRDCLGVSEKLHSLYEHTKLHYQNEEEMMVEKKFPPYPAHKEDHEKSLLEMRDAIEQFNSTQKIEVLQAYVETMLVPWFLRHTETMDAVTSIFLENSDAHLPFWERLVPRNVDVG